MRKTLTYLCKLSTHRDKVSTSFTKLILHQPEEDNTVRSDLHYIVDLSFKTSSVPLLVDIFII